MAQTEVFKPFPIIEQSKVKCTKADTRVYPRIMLLCDVLFSVTSHARSLHKRKHVCTINTAPWEFNITPSKITFFIINMIGSRA